MKQLLFITALAAFMLAACNNAADKREPENNTTAINHLPLTAIYQFDSVVAYLQQAPQSAADTAKYLRSQAVDESRKDQDIVGAIRLFQQSLQFFPHNKTYYELGNALLTRNQDSLAYQAFDMAEKLNYQPISFVLFKKACSLGGMIKEDDWEKREEAIACLKNAIETGFTDRERIYNEPKLASIRKGEDFTYMYNEAMSGNGDPAYVLWANYSSGFRPAPFPIVLNVEMLKNLKQAATISYDFEKFVTEMRDYKFSREVGQEFFYTAKVWSTPDYETVIYGSRSYDYGDDLPYVPARFYLVSYNKKGKLIDKLELAGQRSFDDLFKVATLQQNGNFEIKEYKNSWAKPIGDNGYAGNTIVKSDLVKSSRYRIDSNGKFKSDAELLGKVKKRNSSVLIKDWVVNSIKG